MALLLPTLLLLSVVILDLGRGIYYYSAIYNAAREGARYGIVHQQPYNNDPIDTIGIKTAVQRLTVGLDQSKLTITVQNPIVNGTIRVTVAYQFDLATPLAKMFTTCHCGYINLHSTSAMKIER